MLNACVGLKVNTIADVCFVQIISMFQKQTFMYQEEPLEKQDSGRALV